jgi:hypothetical protein
MIMKFSPNFPDLLKAVDHCQHRSFITNRYTGARIAGSEDYIQENQKQYETDYSVSSRQGQAAYLIGRMQVEENQ